MKYLIDVTQECINNGTPGNPASCPIAKAIKNLSVDFWDLGVTNYYIRINSSYCKVPEEAMNFIDDYDNDKPVKPFKFILDTDIIAIDAEDYDD